MTAEPKSLDRLKARRRGHRGVATKYVQEAKALFEGESRDDSTFRRVRTLQNSLEEKLALLKRLDEKILQVCPTDDIEGEILEADETNNRILTVIGGCNQFGATTEPREPRK